MLYEANLHRKKLMQAGGAAQANQMEKKKKAKKTADRTESGATPLADALTKMETYSRETHKL